MAPMTERPHPLPASGTYYVSPAWVTDSEDGGYGYFRAVLVATGRTVAEADDVSVLVQRMTATRPDLALIENSVTLGCLRDVPPGSRL